MAQLLEAESVLKITWCRISA